MALEALVAAMDDLVVADPDSLADPDIVVELRRQLERLAAVETRAVGRFEARRRWEADGARTAAAWLSVRCRRPRSEVKDQVGLARSLGHLPAAEAAWLAGDIGAAHVRVLARVRRPATQAALAGDESMLVGQAKALVFAGFAKVICYWAQHADPDGEDRDAAAQREARRFHLSQSFEGLWFADGVWDPLSGAAVANEVSRIDKMLFAADWAEAKRALGRDPTVADLARSPAQRRADALVEMAVRSATAPADGRRPEPLFTVLVGWETARGRICELADGTVLAPAALVIPHPTGPDP